VVLAQIRGAVAGGVNVVQIRERGVNDGAYLALIRECVAISRGTGCRVIVNDRLDLALAAGADGVHLRETSIPVAAARRLADTKFLVGRSVHDPRSAAAARNADYMIAGSVFETASKPGQRATLGLEGLRQVVASAEGCPVWAIGGVSVETLPAVMACGIRGVAAIGAFLPRDGREIARDVAELTIALRRALDRGV
jgi:thiamine-phosphate pyrophosphorylase